MMFLLKEKQSSAGFATLNFKDQLVNLKIEVVCSVSCFDLLNLFIST